MPFDIDQSIFKKCLETTGITVVSSSQIAPVLIPEEENPPFLTFHMVSDPQEHTFGNDPRIYQPRYRFNCWSTSINQVQSMSAEVRAVFQDTTGLASSSGVGLQACLYEGRGPLMADIDPDTKKTTYHLPMDFYFWFTT